MPGANKLMTPGGGGVIIQPASSIAADVTVQVPSQNCTLGIQGPAFSAYNNGGQSINSAVATKVQFQTEEFDTNGCFDNTTNYRFTPNVAGYYQISSCILASGLITGGLCFSYLYKNGVVFKRYGQSPANWYSSQGTTLVYANGTTDYFEVYFQQNSGANITTESSDPARYTWFQAALVRAA